MGLSLLGAQEKNVVLKGRLMNERNRDICHLSNIVRSKSWHPSGMSGSEDATTVRAQSGPSRCWSLALSQQVPWPDPAVPQLGAVSRGSTSVSMC